MQLNPARGRKHWSINTICANPQTYGLCSSTPRGDGNLIDPLRVATMPLGDGLCSSTPRGDGNLLNIAHNPHPHWRGLCSSTPRGDGNYELHFLSPFRLSGLCSSTPRGDGNLPNSRFPRSEPGRRFMQLNPARGRKLDAVLGAVLAHQDTDGLCSSTPRGDGNFDCGVT